MSWQQWVAPRSADERTARQEQLVSILSLGACVCGTAYLLTVVVLALLRRGEVHLASIGGGIGCVVLAAGSYALSRSGRARVGATMIVGAAAVIGFYSAFVRGSVTVAAVLLVPAVLFAGLAISGRAGIVVAGVEVVLYGLLALAHDQGWLRPVITSLSPWTGFVLVAAILVLVSLVTWQSMRFLVSSLQQVREREQALQTLNDELRLVLDERQEKEAALQQAMDEVRGSQEEQALLQVEIRRLATPIVPVYQGVLVMPLVGAINEPRARAIVGALLKGVEEQRAHVVILDITGVPMVDTAVAQSLLAAARASRLLGAEPVLVGISPQVAETVVSLGMDLSDLVTQADLQSGLAYALSRLDRKVPAGRR